MRRPEITGFVSVAPPANLYDFSFLAPCPSSGLIINGTADRFAPPADTEVLVNKLHEQKGITITHEQVEGAGHFFEDAHMDTLIDTSVQRRLTENTRQAHVDIETPPPNLPMLWPLNEIGTTAYQIGRCCGSATLKRLDHAGFGWLNIKGAQPSSVRLPPIAAVKSRTRNDGPGSADQLPTGSRSAEAG